MLTIETITTFLGWCAILNIGVFILSCIMLTTSRNFISGIHQKMFGLDQAFLVQTYIHYLAHYKIVIIVFNIVPYIVLKLMGSV